MQIRRVATGHRDGKSVFASDEVVEPIALGGGAAFHLLWGSDAVAHFPSDGSPPSWSAPFPGVGGFRFVALTLPPEGGEGESVNDVFARQLADVMEPEEPGMHTTATIDFEVVLSGEITLELDDGAEVTLRPHDCVVQNGTRHRWTNRGTEPATMAIVLIGAAHATL